MKFKIIHPNGNIGVIKATDRDWAQYRAERLGARLVKESVNHPEHYNLHPSGVECITVVEHYNFNVGNAIKYLWRAGLKSDEGLTNAEKELEDVKKALWYVQRHLQNLEEKCTK